MSASTPKVLLFGAGAIGAVYTYLFGQSCAVTAVCRSNYNAARTGGFTIRSRVFGTVHVQPRVVRSVEDVAGEDFDYVVVCAKAMPGASPSTAEMLRPAVGKRTVLVLIQNGVGIEDEYAALFPENVLLSCVVYLPATQIRPGEVDMGNVELLEIGAFPAGQGDERDQASMHAIALQELVRKGGGTAEVYPDVQIRRWSKLLVNAPWNPICALSRSRDVAFMASSSFATDFVRAVMLEVVAVAQKSGYPMIDQAMADMQLERAKERVGTKGVEPSMMTDALNGRRMEVEAILGNVMRIGREKGVKVDKLEALYVLTKALDESMAAEKEPTA